MTTQDVITAQNKQCNSSVLNLTYTLFLLTTTQSWQNSLTVLDMYDK